MPSQSSFVERHRRLLLLLTGAWIASGAILYVFIPLFSPILVLLSPIVPALWCLSAHSRLPHHNPGPVIIALALAGLYLALNASWSLDPSTSHLTLIMFFLVIGALYVTANMLPELDDEVLRAFSLGLYAGVIIASLIMCFEVFSLQWIRRTLMSVVPNLRPKARDMVVANDWVIILESYLINRNIAAMSFLFWPTVFAVSCLAPKPRQTHWWLAGLIPVVAAVLGSKHATSKIALLGGVAVFVAMHYRPASTRRVVAWTWAALILLVVPLATIAYQSHLYLSAWLPRSAQHRVVIWGHTATLIAEAPILGSGINTARALNNADRYDAPMAPGSDFPLTTGLHSHNGYLQTWYETGAVGALTLLTIGLLILSTLARASPEIQPFLFATFSTCALFGCTSFSLWQPWFMASFGFAAGLAVLGWVLADRTRAQTFIGAYAAGHS